MKSDEPPIDTETTGLSGVWKAPLPHSVNLWTSVVNSLFPRRARGDRIVSIARKDGRAPDQLREIAITPNYLEQPYSSVLVEFGLAYPYAKSMPTMSDFISIWKFRTVSMDTRSNKVVVGIPWDKFKKIFHKNPKAGDWPVPSGADKFIASVSVKEVAVR